MSLFRKVVTDGLRRKYYIGKIKIASFRGKALVPRARRLPRSNNTVLVIRRNDKGCGLFAHFCSNLGWIRWALDHGMMPYVDMETVPNVINRGKRLGFNPWECFFKQCAAYRPVDALSAAKLRTTPESLIQIGPKLRAPLLAEDNPDLLAWRRLVHEQIRLSDAMAAEVERVWRRDFGDGNVLGCLVRGTDYIKLKPKWHAVQPDPEQVVADAEKACREQGFSRVFLATEDLSVEKLFREAFGDRLLRYQTCMPKYVDGFLVSSGAVGDGARALEMSRQYMVSIMLLSRCRGLLAGCTSGSQAAKLFSDGYEWSRVYDLGVYS